MNTKDKLKIIERIWYDNYGLKEHINYVILTQKSFLGITYWSYITHEEGYESGCYKSTTEFKTEEDAKYFIRNILCKNKPYCKWDTTTVFECNCNQL